MPKGIYIRRRCKKCKRIEAHCRHFGCTKLKNQIQGKCEICNTPFVRPGRLRKNARFCSFRCKQISGGRQGGATTGKLMKQRSRGRAYPKIKGRHAHRIIAERILGRALRYGEVVHHEDENILNFAKRNLRVFKSQADHARYHAQQRRIRKSNRTAR